jgi:hypothetical protein
LPFAGAFNGSKARFVRVTDGLFKISRLFVDSGIGRELHPGSSSLREMEKIWAAAMLAGDGEAHWVLLQRNYL